jgi:hypothetical protein
MEILLRYNDGNYVFCGSVPNLFNEDPGPFKGIIEGVS